MTRHILFLLYILFVFSSCSTKKQLSKRHDYAEVINEATFRLSTDESNKHAAKKLKKTYTEALDYYQAEIDKTLSSNDPFKWTKTLDAMQKTNDLSDEIKYNSAASELICDPKIYTFEITDIKQRAVAELYNAGASSLAQHTKEKAKEAYFYFLRAEKLDAKYKDVEQKIKESKNLAVWRIIIDSPSAYTQNNVLGFSTKTFYKTLFYKLREKFPYLGFVNFYSPEEAEKQNITNPDHVIQIEISDFEIGSGTLLNHQTQLLMKANTVLKINSLSEDKTIYKERISWNYDENINYAFRSVINQRHISINSDNQIYFDHFSLSLCDQVVFFISGFYDQYN